MSISQIEFHSPPRQDILQGNARRVKKLIDHLFYKDLQPRNNDTQALLAVKALDATPDLLSRLDQAVKLHRELPEAIAHQTIDPIIDSTSHDTLEDLLAEEHEQNEKSYGLALSTGQIEAIVHAWETTRSKEAKSLADFAVRHAGAKDTKDTLKAALALANEKQMSFDQARDIVNDDHLASLVESHQVTYPWLYDPEIEKPAA